jgi:hypothetical protein
MPVARSLIDIPIPAFLDANRVRTEIALRLARHAAQVLAGTEWTGPFRLLEGARSVLLPVTSGLTATESAYAARYVEEFLDQLATPDGQRSLDSTEPVPPK